MLVTRTESNRAHEWSGFGCGIRETEDGRREGYCERIEGWGYATTRTEQRYRLLYLLDDYARVEVASRYEGDPRATLTRPRLPLDAERFASAGERGERRLLEERADAPVTVPAGTFTCRYRKEAGATEDGLPAVFETWTHPRLPVPAQRVVTWSTPGAPEGYRENTERTVLLAIEGEPAQPLD